MRKLVSSKHLEAISDLTLSAPIKQGFIDAFEAVTYETRLRLVMEALFKVRSTAREYSLIKPFVDTTERIQSLLDFRLAIVEGDPPRLHLSATFDRPFEPYMRLIWDPLGSLLDVIFCNCEGYVTAADHGFPDYLQWVRSVQIDSNFFYAATGHSVNDVQYLSQIERLQREAAAGDSDAAAAAATVADLEQQAARVRHDPGTSAESSELAMEALVALYRLADFYRADQLDGDGRYLLRATQHLLAGWHTRDLHPAVRANYREQLKWFETRIEDPEPPPETTDPVPADMQPGILDRRQPVTHGCLLLMRVKKPAPPAQMVKERGYIAALGDRVWQPEQEGEQGQISYNLAFTRNGLINLGVPEHEMARFPQEFREGMEDRAGLLGDVRESHPRRWTLPRRNWRAPVPPSAATPADTPVDMAEIDFVIQLRTFSLYGGHEIVGDDRHPLHEEVSQIAVEADAAGIELLAVESMRRASLDPSSPKDHFGFADGLSQPALAQDQPEARRDEVKLGELVWGYLNDRKDDPPKPSTYLDNGTFLVVRKLRQDLAALDRFLDEQAARIPGLPREDLLAKMMGRSRSGAPLLPGTTTQSNDFDYENDREGLHCPFQSHIRRANPRVLVHGRPTPRILRRGLSYGPTYQANPLAERGVFFMAYNASIAEQFEVIQRWINGGNSTGVASCQNDPLMGVGQTGDSRTFRFHHGGKLFRVNIPKPFVTLQWGLYLLVPSKTAIAAIAGEPAAQPGPSEHRPTQAEQGEKIIQRLEALAAQQPDGRRAAAEAWKVYLEDLSAKDPGERNEAAAIWAAIRDNHGGALRVPYTDYETAPPNVADVILVASEALVDQVFRDPDDVYSMKGQLKRMEKSFGSIFLGLDRSDPQYLIQSKDVNKAIYDIRERDAFDVAHAKASVQLEILLKGFLLAHKKRAGKIELRRDFITPVLAEVCRHWFGIPDQPFHLPGTPKPEGPFNVVEGGWGWDPAPSREPRCPGDYMAPSRYCFYPDPMPAVRTYGEDQGKGLQQAVLKHIETIRAGPNPTAPPGKLAPAMFAAVADNALLASTIVGVMTGFLPPADGSLRLTLYDWIKEKTLWRIQHTLASDSGKTPYDRASSALRSPLMRAMQKRPSPDIVWRTATEAHTLGNVDVQKGDKVFIGIVSATAEQMAAGTEDVLLIFGGKRVDPPSANMPTHACPAYKAAMGTMLGMLCALLEKGRIEELPSPLIVKLTDPRPLPAG